jgi:hypothetical protein
MQPASTPASVQLPLLESEALSPLPVSPGHYVSVLQNRPGEFRALAAAHSSVWNVMTPLLEFVGPKSGAKRVVKSSTVAGWAKRAAAVLGPRPVYLDTLRLSPGLTLDTPDGRQPVLRYLHDQARVRGMRFVPVVSVAEASAPVEAVIRCANMADGHGVALRYRALKTLPPSGTSRKTLIESQLVRVGGLSEQADLLVDLQHLSDDQEVAGEDIAEVLNELCDIGKWRAVVLLGTSIPQTLSAIPEGTVGSIERREWRLWTELAQLNLPRMPAYGDYAVQHPKPPAESGAGGRANIRYTASTSTVIARGHGPLTEEGAVQYRELCQWLTARAEFAGAGYSWGDGMIADCADGELTPRGEPMWRAAGTSHHIRHVTDALRPHSQPEAVR